VNNGGGFTNITNGGVYSGATSASLSISNSSGLNGYQYRVLVTEGGLCAQTSSSGTLTVNPLAVISVQPVNSTVCSGSVASFSVTATGTTLGYQWRKGGVAINAGTDGGVYTGFNTATLAISDATGLSGSVYDVVVTEGGLCGVTSTGGTLTVNPIASISVQPGNSTVCSGTSASFSVTATGTTLGYQWQVNNGGGFTNITNGGVYSGATSASLSISNSSGLNGYQYRVIVTEGGLCAQTSSSGTLTVNPLAVISVQPVNSTVSRLRARPLVISGAREA
jgi:hypothetical protein